MELTIELAPHSCKAPAWVKLIDPEGSLHILFSRINGKGHIQLPF